MFRNDIIIQKVMLILVCACALKITENKSPKNLLFNYWKCKFNYHTKTIQFILIVHVITKPSGVQIIVMLYT